MRDKRGGYNVIIGPFFLKLSFVLDIVLMLFLLFGFCLNASVVSARRTEADRNVRLRIEVMSK